MVNLAKLSLIIAKIYLGAYNLGKWEDVKNLIFFYGIPFLDAFIVFLFALFNSVLRREYVLQYSSPGSGFVYAVVDG